MDQEIKANQPSLEPPHGDEVIPYLKCISAEAASPCSVEYHLEGLYATGTESWGVIERRSELATVQRDEADHRSFLNESGWRDFRIVKVTMTREILPPTRSSSEFEEAFESWFASMNSGLCFEPEHADARDIATSAAEWAKGFLENAGKPETDEFDEQDTTNT